MKKIIYYINEYDFIISYIFSILMGISLINIFAGNNIFYITLIISVISIIFSIINIFIKKEKIEKIFLKIMIPIGILYLFLVLPNRVPDEDEHIYRAYNISNFKIIPKTNDKGEAITLVPEFLLENNRYEINNYTKLLKTLNKETDYNKVKHTFNSAQAYSFIQYIFSAISFLISRVLGINIFTGIYLARLLNFTVFLVLAYVALKIIPFGKILLFVYMFSPIFLQQIISVSADSLLNSVSIIYISYILYLLCNKKELIKQQRIILAILTLYLALSKYVYFPLIFINLLLIFNKNMNKKDKVFIIIISVISVILALGNYYISTLYNDTRARMTEYNVNSVEQIKFLINNPGRIPSILYQTLKIETPRWIREFFGASLDWLILSIPKKIYYTYAFVLIVSIFLEFKETDKKLEIKQNIYNIIIFGAIVSLILLGLYMTWSSVGCFIIEGVQGRYFIPIAILFLLSIKNYKISIKNKYVNLLVPIFIIAINIATLFEISKFYI